MSNQLVVWLGSLAGLAFVAASGVALASGVPPVTEKRPVTETIHGVQITDEFRWLEGDNSDPENMGKVTEEVSKWTDGQNAFTRSVLDNLPGRKAIEAELRPLLQIGSVSSPAMAGNRYFYTKREGTERQPKAYWREGAVGTPTLLLDPVAIDKSGLTTLSGLSPSPDGKLVAFGMYRAGDENTTIYFINVDTGIWLADQLDGKAGIIDWLPDSSGVFYRRLEDINDPYSAQIRFHKLGEHPRQDPVLFRQYTKEQNAKLATTWGPSANVSRDGRWLVLTYWTGTSSNDIWIVDLRQWYGSSKGVGQPGEIGVRPGAITGGGAFKARTISEGVNANFFGTVENDTLYMLTDYKASRKRIVAVDLTKPSLTENSGAWTEIIPEHESAVLQNVGIAKTNAGLIAVAEYEQNAHSLFKMFDLTGKSLGELKLPGLGSAGIVTKEDRSEAFLSFTSFNYPTTIFRVDLNAPNADPVIWERPSVPIDPSKIEVNQVFVQSKDGTKVPMFVVHKKGLVLNGNNPTILNGYGGFGISQSPGFSATLYPFLDRGGVFASVNLRGGGEFGKTWHEAGQRERKQNVFDDMIAAGDWLVANKYTNPSRLGASGGSNGGLLMGALMIQRPDLFRAILCAVPLLDMLRYQNFLMARYWVPEYGSIDDPTEGEGAAAVDRGREAFAYLRKYSPYHNIKEGTKYPAVLFTAGENDTRVHALHARKMAAAMQAATASNPADQPILLWVDRDAGHGAGKPLDLRLRDATDSRMFFMWQLGMLGDAGDRIEKKAP